MASKREPARDLRTRAAGATSKRRLREARDAHLAAVVESSVDAIISARLDGTIISWNSAAQRLYGYRADEILGKPMSLLVPAGSADELPWLIDRVADGGRVEQFETLRRRKDGALVEALLTISPVRGAGAEIVGVSTIERDVGDQTRAERELVQARADIDAFFDLAIDLMAIANAAGYFVRVNRAFEQTLGHRADELTARPMTDFIHPDDVACTLAAREGQHLGRAVVGLENRYRCADGSYRWLRWHATAAQDGLTYAIARDVTEPKRIEMALREAQERALEASRLKSQFVANMSHEIRTPLNGVVSMAELLLGTSLSDDQREYALVALRSAEALTRVIDDILDFSKIEAGKLDILDEDYLLAATVSEVSGIVGRKAREKGLALAVAIDADVAPVIRGDCNRVRQVLLNLLGNAVKFTAAGEVSVRVNRERAVGGEQRLRFAVSDTGIGIDQATRARLFAPFIQGDATTTRKYGGSGLGLCIAKQLVELMHGQIGLQSSRGEGSTFWFTLPYRPGKAMRPARPDLTPGSPPPAFDKARLVLVAEDNEINQVAARQVLQKLGFAVDIAANGLAAIEMSGRRDYAVVLMDCQMPEVDGYQAVEAIRRRERGRRHTPIVAMTAHTMAGDREKCLAAGMDGYIAKPLRIAELQRVLGDLLTAPLIDREILDAILADGGREEGLVEMFMSSTRERLRELAAALNEGDARRVGRVAHSLKGASSTFGATRLASLGARLAALDGAPLLSEARRLQAELEHTLALTARAAREHGDGAPGR